MWSLFEVFRRRLTSAFRPATSKRKPIRRWQPWVELLEDRWVPTSITQNFNGTAIPHNDTLWFDAVAKISGAGSNPVTITVTNQTVTFTDSLAGARH